MNYPSNNEKKQDAETSLKYISGYLKFDFQKDLEKSLEPIMSAIHRIANALEDKRHGNN